MRLNRCRRCGCIIYDEYAGDLCDVCIDEELSDDDQDVNDVKETGDQSSNQ